MRCPFCGNVDTQVKDSRPAEDNVAIRRRRFCPACGGRFTTYERVQLRDLVVVKSNGRREDFDRDKMARSIRIAMQKRPIEAERIDQLISGIVRRLESMGETDISSKIIGEIVMETLARIDNVAYVRFEYLKGHAYGFGKVRDGLIILIRYAKIQHNAYQLKGGMAELLIQLQAVEQQQAVLAAGYADAYLIAGMYHAVSFIGTPYAAENTFHNKNTFQITIYKAL